MSMSSMKAAFAFAITGLGAALLMCGNQGHSARCGQENCESCVFCSLATPACLGSCQSACAASPSASSSADMSEGNLQDADDVLGASVPNEMELENREYACPVALDRQAGNAQAAKQSK
jgi:hypothetical protein